MKKDVQTKLVSERDRRLRELPEFVYDFISFYKTRKAISTQIEYIKDITKFLEFLLEQDKYGDKNNIMEFTTADLGKVVKTDIDNFLSYLVDYEKAFKKKDGSIATQRFSNTEAGQARKLATLHTLYRYLVQEDIIEIDPTVKVGVALTKNINVSNRLDDNELSVYLDTILDDIKVESKKAMDFHKKLKYRDYIITLILSYTGIRVSELVQLDIPDVNLEKGKITVFRKRKKKQAIDLPTIIIEPLREFIEERKKIEDVDSKYKDALFLSLQKKRINTRTVRHLVNKYKLRSQLELKITPHVFRKTFGTKLYNTHGDIELTRDVLGHETSDTTRHYVHIDEERERKAMRDFDYNSADTPQALDINVDMIKLIKLSEKTGVSLDELLKTLSEG